jgi:hypothetical protein
MRRTSVAALTGALLACAPAAPPVARVLSSSAEEDGKRVQVSGIVTPRGNMLNLFSRSGKECIGLLVSDEQKKDLRQFVGRRVVASGILDAQACGRNGVCSEHLCGPAVLRDVTLRQ